MEKYSVLLSPSTDKNNLSSSVSGSKSYTNRAILIAALADGISEISNLLRSDDTDYMISCLKNLGVTIDDLGDKIVVHGNSGVFNNIINTELFCGIAGTTSRFITALCMLINQDIIVNGEGKILERPIGDLVDAMIKMGAKIDYLGKEGSLPLKAHGTKDVIDVVEINGEVSSQFVSGLLMIAPYLKNGLTINIIGDQVSKSYIDITVDIMKYFGIQVQNNNYGQYIIKHGVYKACNYVVEGDWSSASYFFAITGFLNQKVTIKNVYQNSVQGDARLVSVLKNFGISTTFNKHIAVTDIDLSNIKTNPHIDMQQMPDTAMTIMMLSAIMSEKSIITGLSTLKDKECDRLEVPKNELLKFGINCQTTDDSITIFGKTLNNVDVVEIDTYHDHRIAMCFSLFGAIRKVLIKDAHVVNKSFPNYWQELQKLGVNVQFL